VDGLQANLAARLRGGERVEVHPVETREAGLPPRFVLDVHLGRLAADLRLLGIDAAYGNSLDDDALQAIAVSEGRVLLTRDTGLLKRTDVPAGAFVYATAPAEQLAETVARFGLAPHARPWSRCTRCNAGLVLVAADAVAGRIPPRVRATTRDFLECTGCRRVYWRGTHEAGLRKRLGAAEARVAPRACAPTSPPDLARTDR
jgi:uncharacterized protein with PIN domain